VPWNSTNWTSNLRSSSFQKSATPPWAQLAALEHMMVYPEYPLLMIFVPINTATPIPICTNPMAICVNLPPLLSTIFHVTVQNVPLPSWPEGAGFSVVAGIPLVRYQRPKMSPSALVWALLMQADRCKPHIPHWNGGMAGLVVV
jgi:hypothetical protein